MSNASDMKHLMELWGNTEFTNELNETDYKPDEIKKIYAQIIPMNGSVSNFGNVEPQVNNVSVTHKLKVRYYSYPDIKIDNWFLYKSQKYEIISFNQDFKNRDFWEIMTKIVYE